MEHLAGRPPGAGSGLERRQTARQIRLQISQVFKTDGNADQVVTNPCIGPFGRCQTAMGSGRRMGNGGLGITQVGGDGDHPRGINKAPGSLFATLDLKADHGTEGTLLTLGQFMLRMAGQACVILVLDAWLLLQP